MKKNQKNTIEVLIEKENKRDKMIKKVFNLAWATTLIVLFIFLVFAILEFMASYKMYTSGRVKFSNVIDTLIPFLIIFGSIALIIAVLSTIAIFLRLRTANLLEVQQRLDSLEKMILSEK